MEYQNMNKIELVAELRKVDNKQGAYAGMTSLQRVKSRAQINTLLTSNIKRITRAEALEKREQTVRKSTASYRKATAK